MYININTAHWGYKLSKNLKCNNILESKTYQKHVIRTQVFGDAVVRKTVINLSPFQFLFQISAI